MNNANFLMFNIIKNLIFKQSGNDKKSLFVKILKKSNKSKSKAKLDRSAAVDIAQNRFLISEYDSRRIFGRNFSIIVNVIFIAISFAFFGYMYFFDRELINEYTVSSTTVLAVYFCNNLFKVLNDRIP